MPADFESSILILCLKTFRAEVIVLSGPSQKCCICVFLVYISQRHVLNTIIKYEDIFWHLQVENPSCLWGRVIWGQSRDSETTEQYNTLLAQMNLFYHDLTQDLRKLKPTSLEEGQVTQHLQSLSTFLPAPGRRHFGTLIQLDVCVIVFALRYVWCIGQWWSCGVGLWWSLLSWTQCPVRFAASW